MARPVQIKEETILAAARDVFLERGIRATTAEVAVRAGVSEGSIFKRFRSKFELFRAAMVEALEEPLWLRDLPVRVGRGEIRDELVDLGDQIIEFFRSILPLIMMSWSNPAPNGVPTILEGPDPPPVRAARKLAGYFEAEMRAGRLRRLDPEVVARAYLGGLNQYVFTQVVLKDGGDLPLPQEMYVRGLVQLLLAGIAP
ncbi:MAG TPA: TetR/AcrR family transcriptional regulator [Minicystis sp.]|nr:TetR/AcrR family transcriptional regulator [Minicystis sp.]